MNSKEDTLLKFLITVALAVFFAFLLVAFTACGRNEKVCVGNGCEVPPPSPPGEPVPGSLGPTGPAGPGGKNCSVTTVSTGAVILCPDGSSASVANGKAGIDGSSCTTTQLSNGSQIDCSDGTHSLVLNGEVGSAGPVGPVGELGPVGQIGSPGERGRDAAPTAFTVVDVINPCGENPGFNEVLLKLADGKILAHYADGAKQFFTLLSPGSYRTTDGDSCLFTLNSDGSISDEHH